jgi:hypothetical protein
MNIVSIKMGNLYDKSLSKVTYRKEIATMFKIVHIPLKLKSFFNSLENQFHFNHFDYFQTLVLLIAFSWGRRNITALYRHLDNSHRTHRSRFNNFLNVGRWNCQTVLQIKACELLSNLNPQISRIYYFLRNSALCQERRLPFS